jgi:predicted GNAT family N-acyltransferase
VADEAAIHSNLAVDAPSHPGIFVRPVSEAEVPLGMALASAELPQAIASEDMLRQVRSRNPDSLWGVFERQASEGAPPKMLGFCAFLILNTEGAAALLRRTFDLHQIHLDYIAPSPDSAEIVYIWGILAKGVSASVVAVINEVMVKRYRGRPIYATAATEAGLQFLRKWGYRPISLECDGIGALHRRIGKRPPPDTSATTRRHNLARYRIVPVATADEFEKALAIRNIFLTEQNCPYEEEFDGNDRTGTLFLGYVDDEPAATLRIRYFSDFIKMERLAVLPRFRRTLVARQIVLEAVNFCRRKGYRRGFGHAQKRYMSFWAKFGFKPTERSLVLTFSDHEYIEMYGDLEPHERALTMDTDPYVMLRPEGRWDEPGLLERSAVRLPANQHDA